MDLYVFGIVVALIVAVALIVNNIIEYKKRAISIQSKVINKDKNGSHFQDYLDNLPMAKQQAINIYNQQLAECTKNKLTQEQAEAVLKPLLDKIKLLESIEKYEPLARAGAMIADTGVNAVQKVLKDIGSV